MVPPQFGDRFRRGLLAGLLGWATVIALSYFFRSGGWGNLLGTRPGGVEAIGFPWIIWEQGHPYGRFPALLADTGIGLLIGVAAGLAALRFGGDPWKARDEGEPASGVAPSPSRHQLQFSLRTLFAVTALVAVLLAVERTAVTARPVLLGIVYFFGPSLIVLVWYHLRRVVWRHRNGVVIIVMLLLVLAAAILGQTIGAIGDFTKGIFGTFVFWVPQCTLIALLLALRTAFSAGNAHSRLVPVRPRRQRGRAEGNSAGRPVDNRRRES